MGANDEPMPANLGPRYAQRTRVGSQQIASLQIGSQQIASQQIGSQRRFVVGAAGISATKEDAVLPKESAEPRASFQQTHDRDLTSETYRAPWGSFEEFYEAAYPRLLRLSVALVWSRAIAEDHVQDAFAKTYARFATLDEPEAYVRRTLVNEVRISFRRKQMMLRFAPLLRSAPSHSDRYTDDSLLKGLDSLPIRQRTAVILRYYEQCSEQEIAHALNCRPGTVKSLLSRGLASLRKVVDHV